MALFSTLTANFDAGIPGTFTTAVNPGGGSAAADSGAVRCSHTTVANSGGILQTATTYDLTGSTAAIQVQDYGNMTLASHQVGTRLVTAGNDQLNWVAQGATLIAYTLIGGVANTRYTATLDLVNHRWIRFREASGTTFWETSADGSAWVTRASVANPITLTALTFMAYAYTDLAPASASSALFDNFNSTATINFNTLVSNFDAGIPATFTTLTNAGGGSVAPENGAVRCSHTTAADSGGILQSALAYDLTGSHAYVQVKDFGNMALAPHQVGLRLQTGSDHINWQAQGPNLIAYKLVSGTPTTLYTTTLNTATHAWLSIRELGGQTFFDTSTDGISWVNRVQVANPIAITAMTGLVYAYAVSATTASSALFDNFNTAAVGASPSVKDWDGSAWTLSAPVKEWSGSAWVLSP